MASNTPAEEPDQLWLDSYRPWVKQMPVAVIIYANDGRILMHNSRAAELFGCSDSPQSDQGRYTSRARGVDDPVQQVLLSGQTAHDQPLIFACSDGSQVHCLANIAPVRNSGRVVGALCTLQQVAGKPLCDSETMGRERLPEIVDGAPALVAELNGPYHIIDRVNHYCKELAGGADIVGKAAADAWPQLRDQGYLDPLDQVLTSGEPYLRYDVPVWLKPAAGAALTQMRCNIRYQPIARGDGETTGVSVTIMDVSSRAQAAEHLSHDSERKLRLYETILANTPDLVYVFDLNHRFTYANAALLEMWGETWAGAAGKNCLELGYEPWHAAMHDREIDRVIRTKQEVRGEVPFHGTAGNRYYDYIFVPVLGKNGEVEAIAGTSRDTTGRKQLERELQRRADALSESDRKKDEFIAMLAHELRNPLAPIRNGLQVMELASGDAAVVEQARMMMQRQLKHLVRLVDDLMDVSRITRNKLNLQKSTISIDEVIDSAVETARGALEAAGHALSVSLPAQTYYLHADLTRLAQVFSNLLSNSIKYTKPGGHITLQAVAEDTQLKIDISDNGIGIPPHKLESVFDLFSQVSSDARDGDGGLGIGLALVQALVEMHGGTVTVTSSWPQSGTKFTVRLPFVSAPSVPSQVEPAPSESPTDFPSQAQASAARGDASRNKAAQPSRKILVVDDNADACRSMSQLFDLLGHQVRSAFNGVEALRIAEEFKPEVVFMDLGMPKLNGFEAARRIRAQPWGEKMLIIAVTGWGQDCDRENSKNAGFSGHLVKPVNLQTVQEQLALLDQ